MSDLAAAARILADLAQALDEADDWAPSTIVTVYDLAGHLQLDPGPDDHAIAAALLDAARAELAVPEVQCPACSATIRARLMDQPGALATTCDAMDGPSGVGGPCVMQPGHHMHRDGIGGEWTRHETPRTLTEADLPLAYELCAQVCESESATVAGHFLGQLRDLLGPDFATEVTRAEQARRAATDSEVTE